MGRDNDSSSRLRLMLVEKLVLATEIAKDVLEASGIRRAKLVAVCTNKRAITDRIVDLIKSEFPDSRLFVRSYDRTHTLELRSKGVEYELRETFESGLRFGQKTLEALGLDEDTASEILEDVRRRDEERLALQAVEGTDAGRGTWYTRPVTPEPLIKPKQEAKRIDKEGQGEKVAEPACMTAVLRAPAPLAAGPAEWLTRTLVAIYDAL